MFHQVFADFLSLDNLVFIIGFIKKLLKNLKVLVNTPTAITTLVFLDKHSFLDNL
jgi:hypothetical protein